MIIESPVKRWLARAFPLHAPRVVELRVRGGLDHFDEPNIFHVGFPLLQEPKLSPDLNGLTAKVLESDLALAPDKNLLAESLFARLSPPEAVSVAVDQISDLPTIFDLFLELASPGRAGKQYRETEQLRLPVVDRAEAERSDESCKHGLPLYSCEICLQNQEKARQPPRIARQAGVARTADVFDLLLPLLQPPIEPLLDQPLLFPPDRRPYPYQVQGIKFLANHESALLGDEMGLGKTIMTIIAMQLLFRQGKIRKVLIVCPLSVLGTWKKELEFWAPELFVLKVRGRPEAREWMWEADAAVYLTTYETVRDDTKRYLVPSTKFDLVVLDEIQKVKNPNTGLSRSVRNLGPTFRWGLSGTPLENKTDDIVAIFRFLRPGLFDSSTKKYRPRILRSAIKPFFLRRRIGDVKLELPDKVVETMWLDLSDEQREAYDQIEQTGKRELTGPNVTRLHVFALISRLMQVCNLEEDRMASSKLDYMVDQLESIVENDHKALVFSQFPNKTLTLIRPLLAEYDPEIYHGGLSEAAREKIITDFQQTEKPRVLLMSLRAGGLGISLTRASHVFHFDHWWNPAISKQAEARTYRIGQKETVFVQELYTNDTIEERVHSILEQKQQLFDEVIDELSVEDAMSYFTDADLFGLFDLEPPDHLKAKAAERPRVIQLTNLQSRIRKLSPKGLENLVGDLYRERGFKVEVTGRAGDEGVDLVARRLTDVGTQYLIIQCKHYPDRPVGPRHVRELIGTWQDHRDANRAILITSGKFSDMANHLARKHKIDLVDGINLAEMTRKEGLEVTDRTPE